MALSKNFPPADDDVENLGPAMAECTPPERKFVRALFDDDGQKRGLFARAAKAAGYSATSNDGLSRAANKLFHRPRVIAAIQELTKLLIRKDAPMAVRTVREIMSDKSHRDRLKAARTVLERVDAVEQHHKVDVEINDRRKSHDEQAIEILRYYKSLGLDRDALEKIFGFSGHSILEEKLAKADATRAITHERLQRADVDVVDVEFSEIPEEKSK